MTEQEATQKINEGYEKAVIEATLAAPDGSTPPCAWEKWIPLLKLALKEHTAAQDLLERTRHEVGRICYCLQRDRDKERQA